MSGSDMKNKSEKIQAVLADDHAMVRAGICQFVEKTGEIQVIYEASNGQEVIYYLSTCHSKVDVVILDIKMPNMNGIEGAKKESDLHAFTRNASIWD